MTTLTEETAKLVPECFGKYCLEEAGNRTCLDCDFLGLCATTTREQQDASRKTTEIIHKPAPKNG